MINKAMKHWIRLPLEKAFNVRELGGIPACIGGQTSWHSFLRADDISRLTDKDVQFLLEYGVSTVIDLRSPLEVAEKPDRLGAGCGVLNVNIPLLADADLSRASLMEFIDHIHMDEMYLDMLERKEAIKSVFDVIAADQDGCVLFHCSAGKDRTGVVAMLLLMLAGADKQDCLNHYIQSYVNLTRDEAYNEMMKTYNAAQYLMESRPEYLAKAYQYVDSFSGGIVGYLESCGISSHTIFIVREKLLGSGS